MILNNMKRFLKGLLIFLSGILLGFGMGAIFLKEVLLSSVSTTLVISLSLIIGAFVFVIALTIKTSAKKEKNEEASDYNSKQEL